MYTGHVCIHYNDHIIQGPTNTHMCMHILCMYMYIHVATLSTPWDLGGGHAWLLTVTAYILCISHVYIYKKYILLSACTVYTYIHVYTCICGQVVMNSRWQIKCDISRRLWIVHHSIYMYMCIHIHIIHMPYGAKKLNMIATNLCYLSVRSIHYTCIHTSIL